MKISVKAKSSSEEPYTVDFLVDGNKLTVFCNCQAGKFRQLCKHKTELIAGDKGRLFDENETHKLDEIQKLIGKSPHLQEIANRIAESEKMIRREQSKLKKIKKEFAEKLKGGIDVVYWIGTAQLRENKLN